ncbi:RING membrane-anchor 3 [Actinidia rufa]|uniref:E3 ubiquitin-protein ligase RMA n=1 Tax=Actinidia rufa TaxID=165716 RepID=A0A7J0G4J5_9ERIC|nr:RING membrane-anchor 3 [Actinidia rufa]
MAALIAISALTRPMNLWSPSVVTCTAGLAFTSGSMSKPPPPESNEPPKCPVCKANISQSSLVPLYGRGPSEASSESDTKGAHRDAVIPHRPPALGVHTTSVTSHSNQPFSSHPFQSPLQPFHHQQMSPHLYGTFPSMASPNFGGTAMIGIFPIVGMFGEMVFTRMFGSSDTRFFADMYSNAYPSMGNGSPRMRRQEMQVDKSLNRVTIFSFLLLYSMFSLVLNCVSMHTV